MQDNDLQDMLVLQKKLYRKLTDVLDLTEQLAQAVDRQDQVSVRLLLSMRQTPVFELEELNSHIELKNSDLNAEDRERYKALLDGAAPVRGEEELTKQVAANHRILERLLELDGRVSRKLGGERSCYPA